MSLNGWGGKLHEDLLAYVGATVPDILCLQEVVHSPIVQKDWLTYRDDNQVLPQRANFFTEVARVLPDHVAVFCPAAQGVLWDAEEAVPSQWGWQLSYIAHSRLSVRLKASCIRVIRPWAMANTRDLATRMGSECMTTRLTDPSA